MVLAGDNAIVVGMAAAGLPQKQRTKAIPVGMAGAAVLLHHFRDHGDAASPDHRSFVCRRSFAALGVLENVARASRSRQEEHEAVEPSTHADINEDGKIGANRAEENAAAGGGQIILADLSMSLDNVLAVGAAAREHPFVLIFGLSLSILLMGVAASFIARLLQKYRWIAYVGLAVILYVALAWSIGEPSNCALLSTRSQACNACLSACRETQSHGVAKCLESRDQ